MKPKLSIPLPISNFLKKYLSFVVKNHYFLSIVFLMAGLAFVIYMANLTLQAPSDQNYREQQNNAGTPVHFDQQTIDKVTSLRQSSDQTPLSPLPSGVRINPFAE